MWHTLVHKHSRPARRKALQVFFRIHIKKESENVMSTFDNFTVHPYKYLDICTWEETSKPKISFVDSFDYLDGKRHSPLR